MSPILIGAGSFLIRKLGQLTAGMHRSKLSIDYISYMILAVSGGDGESTTADGNNGTNRSQEELKKGKGRKGAKKHKSATQCAAEDAAEDSKGVPMKLTPVEKRLIEAGTTIAPPERPPRAPTTSSLPPPPSPEVSTNEDPANTAGANETETKNDDEASDSGNDDEENNDEMDDDETDDDGTNNDGTNDDGTNENETNDNDKTNGDEENNGNSTNTTDDQPTKPKPLKGKSKSSTMPAPKATAPTPISTVPTSISQVPASTLAAPTTSVAHIPIGPPACRTHISVDVYLVNIFSTRSTSSQWVFKVMGCNL
ncbi:hypothetical protein K443DRAFT_16113 [Laccaria amethystina LaAM-08-1]|uniref:Uncharacterized protein n=1 Tax=Laccaria amethystina LaAM-08-1 TaxID=1095629 RepID=A0A0C9WW21_9AGAR|nr:hypothetical protein K443DRAFT_16113 [Laccaria amethystina LaAM-08-1]